MSAIAVYLRVGGNAFVDFDDGAYVYENDAVRGGLTLDGVGWAFTATHSSNWHPLTWLSHMLDVSLFGLEPAGHHWVNVLLHAASTVALFFVLRALTGAEGRSAFVAALFGLHPLHVESVAWVAERKDVLSAFFWILTLGAWVRWVRAPSLGRYWTSVGLFVLALLAKPMAVTLPAVLLLLDVWPLRRWTPFEPGGSARVKPLVAEKAPFLVLAFLSSYVTWAVQAAGSATGSLATFPFDERAANAVVAYGTYLAKIVWPASLGVFYPHPSTLGIGIELAPLALSAVLLIALFLVAWRERVRRPYLLVGGLWFLGTLVPVIGLVQVGSQAYADRYTYLPSIGVFLAVVWAVGEWLERRPEQLATVASVGAGVSIALGVVTWMQTAHWRDNDSLYRRAIDVDERSWLAWNNLGNQRLGRGELEPALRCFEEAVRIFPRYAAAYYNLGNVRLQRMERDEAVAAYRRSLELDDSNLDAWNNLGVAFLNLGRYPEAVAQFESALELEPRHADSLENLALAYSLQKDRARAEEACRRLAEVDPARAVNARSQLGLGP
ncbi:MAG: tetratricopeptide repeat protein [Planctomycetes bacterium]|nr:tetratricopeptide repeat protein [Planctomycetota bacterium]